MWSKLRSFICQRRLVQSAVFSRFLEGGVHHLQEVAEWLDFDTLKDLQVASCTIHQWISSDGFLLLLSQRHPRPRCRARAALTLEAVALADELATLQPEVFFERASTSVHEDSVSDIRRLAEVCRRHSRRLVLYVSGHCGRNAPEFIKFSFTLERAASICQEILEIIQLNRNEQAAVGRGFPAMYVWGCGSAVAARDIPLGGATNWSKADLRFLLRNSNAEVLVDWGAQWWQPQHDGAVPLEEPEWFEFPWEHRGDRSDG